MQQLLAFIVAKRHWFLLLICEIISFVLIYQNNAYQQHIMLSSANAVTGKILSSSGTILSYFELQKVNQELLERNGQLEMEVVRLNEHLNNRIIDKSSFNQVFLKDTVTTDSMNRKDFNYRFISAKVIKNSAKHLSNNYITINKGANEGIRPDMGIISPQGVVGIVTIVNDDFAVAMSLLHLKSKVSCKIQHTHFFGPLSWKGNDVNYAYLERIPAHATFQAGDTIVTSGYSDFFPPGIMVGVIESYNRQEDDDFYSLKVRFATDFHSLNAIQVIDYRMQNEQIELEREARKND